MADVRSCSYRSVKLRECAEFQEGYVNPSQGVPAYFGGEIKWLRAVDLNDSFVRETSRRLSKLGFESAGKAALLFEPNTLAISKSGTIGRLGILKDFMCGNRAVINIRVDQQNFDTRFVFYSLSVKRNAIAARAVGSVQPNLYCSELGEVEITAPPLPEQRAIASVLGALDDKIDLNRRMCQTLEEMARALFKSWFVDFDPVRAKMEGRDPGLPKEIADLFPIRLVNSELGPIPEGWHPGTADDATNLNPESWSAKSRPTVVRYLDLASAKWGRLDDAQELSGEAIPSRAQRILRNGDTIVGTVRPGNGSYGLISDTGLTGSTGFAVLRPKKSHFRAYVYFTTTSQSNIDRLSRLADGGAYPAVRPDVVSATPCVIPSEQLLHQLETVAGALLDRIAHGEGESRTLAALRDTLLPKLISGELRVPASPGSMQEVAS